MNVYVDSSVLLRIVLGERGTLREWCRIQRALASEVIRLECLRTIDRARIQLRLDARAVAERRAAVMEQLDGFEMIALDRSVLDRAAEPFPTLIGSLDALHLASAVLARTMIEDLYFATHDAELALAAQSVGFRILGMPKSRKGR